MITEIRTENTYTCLDGDKTLLTVTSKGNNVYRAVNNFFDITAEVVPLDDYRTSLHCIEHKAKGKDGRFRKSNTLLQHNLSWLRFTLEDIGFIRKSTAIS